MLQLFRTQKSSNLLYLKYFRVVRRKFTKQLRTYKRYQSRLADTGGNRGVPFSDPLAETYLFLLYPKLCDFLPHPHAWGPYRGRRSGFIERCGQQRAKEARENQQRVDIRDQRAAAWNLPWGGINPFLGLEP